MILESQRYSLSPTRFVRLPNLRRCVFLQFLFRPLHAISVLDLPRSPTPFPVRFFSPRLVSSPVSPPGRSLSKRSSSAFEPSLRRRGQESAGVHFPVRVLHVLVAAVIVGYYGFLVVSADRTPAAWSTSSTQGYHHHGFAFPLGGKPYFPGSRVGKFTQ